MQFDCNVCPCVCIYRLTEKLKELRKTKENFELVQKQIEELKNDNTRYSVCIPLLSIPYYLEYGPWRLFVSSNFSPQPLSKTGVYIIVRHQTNGVYRI